MMYTKFGLVILSLLIASMFAMACGDDDKDDKDTGPMDVVAAVEIVAQDATEPDPRDVATPQDLVPEIAPVDLAPDLGPQPPAPPAYEGTCPQFVAGPNVMEADGRNRNVQVYLPGQPEGAPVVFIWHGNGDKGESIANFFMAQAVTQEYGAIVVAPNSCCMDNHTDCCDYSTTWNVGTYSKTEADLPLFDKTLACLEEQFDIDNRKVYTTGFSAGALWSTYLLVNRSDYFAAASIFSGGTGVVVTYQTPNYKMPVLLAWGGENDTYMGVVSFDEMTKNFSAALREDGHFVVECNHGPYAQAGQGHTIPFTGPTWGHKFMFAHEWSDGTSPFAETGLTDEFPDYCRIPE